MQLDFFGLRRPQTRKDKPADQEVLFLSGAIEVEIHRRAYQRRWNLSVHPNGRVRLSCGKNVSPKAIQKWLAKMQPWIEKSLATSAKLREKYPPKKFIEGEGFLYLGIDHKLRLNGFKRSAVIADSQEILLNADPETPWSLKQERLQALYKKQARRFMPERVKYWSECMGLYPSGLSLRGQKTRWGSCSSSGEISLNWKLMAAPVEALDYVVIHELAHLKHPNHSEAFWNLVEAYCPEYRGLKRWLKDNHYGFEFL